jgi:hypothetical protein
LRFDFAEADFRVRFEKDLERAESFFVAMKKEIRAGSAR